MTNDNIVKINMSYNPAEAESAGLPPAAEISVVYRRLPYEGLLQIEDAFIVRPFSQLAQDGRNNLEASKQPV